MILSDNEEERREALKFLLPYQKGDFKGIYEAMETDLLPSDFWIRRSMSSCLIPMKK